MKLEPLILLAILINFASASSFCEKPPNKVLLIKCCSLPTKISYEIVHSCAQGCVRAKSRDHSSIDNCIVSCMVGITKVVVKGKVDKAVVKNMYKEQMNATMHSIGIDFVDDAVDKCNYDETSSNQGENLAKFYDCVENNFLQNCYEFKDLPECSDVAEYFEECKNISSCDFWPSTLPLATSCCTTPPIIPDDFFFDCHSKCHQKFFLEPLREICVENCTTFDTKIVLPNGNVDYKVVKEMLMKSANNSKWEKAINTSIEETEATLSGFNFTENMEQYVSMLHTSLTDSLASYCVEFDDTKECKRVERFIKRCPDAMITNPFEKRGKFFDGMPPFGGQFGGKHHPPHFGMGDGPHHHPRHGHGDHISNEDHKPRHHSK